MIVNYCLSPKNNRNDETTSLNQFKSSPNDNRFVLPFMDTDINNDDYNTQSQNGGNIQYGSFDVENSHDIHINSDDINSSDK